MKNNKKSMKTQTILDEYREKFTTSEKALGWTEIKFKNLLELESWLKEKLEQVERDMIEKIKGIGLRLALTDDDVVSDAHITGQEEMKNRIINSLKEEKNE